MLGTVQDNVNDMVSKGRDRYYGEKNGSVKLMRAQVEEVRLAYDNRQHHHWGCSELAKKFGVRAWIVSRIAHRLAWCDTPARPPAAPGRAEELMEVEG
jgi:hypothetical protein